MRSEKITVRLDAETLAALDALPGSTRTDRVIFAIRSRVVLSEIVERMDRIERAMGVKSTGPDPVAVIEKIQAVLVQLAESGEKTRADMRRGLDAIYKSVNGSAKQ